MRLAFTADLHWGHHRRGDEATRLLVSYLSENPPDVLVIGGDIGTGDHFGECLGLFAHLPSRKALVPGNHDIWVPTDAATDSLHRYEEVLPGLAGEHGFHYLDRGPLVLPEADLVLAGSINWYDYSWAATEIRRLFPQDEYRLVRKQFTRGRHNDAVFVRWPLDDAQFTERVVTSLQRQITEAFTKLSRAIVVTHHPAFYNLGFSHAGLPMLLDSYLWDAFAGNRRLEEWLSQNAARIPLVFSGHTHRQRSANLGPIQGYNIGGDYHFKRLLMLDWPSGTIEQHQFGDPTKK